MYHHFGAQPCKRSKNISGQKHIFWKQVTCKPTCRTSTGFGSSDLKFTKPKSSSCLVNFPPSLSHDQSISLVARIFPTDTICHLHHIPPTMSPSKSPFTFIYHRRWRRISSCSTSFRTFRGFCWCQWGGFRRFLDNQGNHNGLKQTWGLSSCQIRESPLFVDFISSIFKLCTHPEKYMYSKDALLGRKSCTTHQFLCPTVY